MLITNDLEVERAVAEAARRTRVAVTVARTAHEALKGFTYGFDGYSLILLDLDPDIHGVTLFNALDECHGNAPVVVLTGCEPIYMKPLVTGRGAADCIGKPVAPGCFTRLLGSHCHAPAR